MTAQTMDALQGMQLDDLIRQASRLIGALGGGPAPASDPRRHDPFAFRNAMTAGEEEVYGDR